MENSTKIPIILLKIFGFWEFEISKRKSLNLLFFLYKIVNLSLLIYEACNVLTNSIMNFDFEKWGLAEHFVCLVTLTKIIFNISVILEIIFTIHLWKTFFREFEEVETFFG